MGMAFLWLGLSCGESGSLTAALSSKLNVYTVLACCI